MLTEEELAIRARYEAAKAEQLTRWVAGDPWHNPHPTVVAFVDEAGKVTSTQVTEGGECCPDFSCCKPELLWPEPLRKTYAAAGPAERSRLLLFSLGSLLEATGHASDVHVAGGDPGARH